ncbi:phage integrase family site specific recombinase, partial [mine drainage metagenome]
MATVTRRESGRWQAKVRKAGAPAISRTFRTKADAEAWARKLESEQERGVWRDTSDSDRTLDDLLDEYARERLPA